MLVNFHFFRVLGAFCRKQALQHTILFNLSHDGVIFRKQRTSSFQNAGTTRFEARQRRGWVFDASSRVNHE